MLLYLDDILEEPQSSKAATAADCLRASTRLYHVLERLDISRHPTKGVWGDGAQELEYLYFHVSTISMRSTATEKRRFRMKRMEGKLLRQSSQGKGTVSAECLTSSCGSAMSLMLSVSFAMLYTRSLHDLMPYDRRDREEKRARF